MKMIKRSKEEDLKQLFENVTGIKERNSKIVQAYREGYSQHMMAKF